MCCSCGDCVKTCPTQALAFNEDHKVLWNPALCVDCDTCIHVCPHHASPKIRWLSAEELMAEIEDALPFIQGITVSGGECMNQADFLLEVFTLVKKRNKTCLIDSNGAHDFRQYRPLLDVSDGVMLDVKAINPQFHQQLTRRGNERVLENLKYLMAEGKLEEVRTVLLPNRDQENAETVRAVSELLQGKVRYKLLRYRPFGVSEEGLQFCGRTIYPLEMAEALKQAEEARGFHNIVLV